MINNENNEQKQSYEAPTYTHSNSGSQSPKNGGSGWKYVLCSFVSVMLTLLLCSSLLLLYGAKIVELVSSQKQSAGIVQSPATKEVASNPNEKKESSPTKAKTPATHSEADDSGLVFDNNPETTAELEKLSLVTELLRKNYYKELTDAEILAAMTKGLMGSLDSPYTFYIDQEANKRIQDSMKGEYSGIGAIVQSKDKTFFIADLVDNSPALKAGLKVGDSFVSVNGTPVSEFKDVSDLASTVRGESGTAVKIVIFRASDNQNHEFEIKRQKISNANLHAEMLPDSIGYIRIKEFNSGVAANFKTAVKDLLAQGAKTFIFDVRGNGGGYVNEVTAMLDYLLPEGELASIKGRQEGAAFSDGWHSDAKMSVPADMKYVILINEYSASASELFSGCLRDWDKAVLVGQKSFGKGVGTISYDLSDGSAVQITNFKYYLPKGDSPEGVGIAPTYEVKIPTEASGKTISQLTKEEDTQLAKAVALAKERMK